MYRLFIFLLMFSIVFGANFKGPDDTCIKCLCHGRTGCFLLRNCASYSIRQDYWVTAGSPTITIGTSGMQAFDACMKNDECIRETIRGYMREFPNPDCNSDGIIDCKDFAMIHYEREKCNLPHYNSMYIGRLDRCLKQNLGDDAPKPGWEVPAE